MPLALVHRGYSVYISCEGKEIPHYQVQLENEGTVTCYIPSEAGKNFVIHYEDLAAETDTTVIVYSDGRRMYGFGCEKGQYDLIDGVRTAQNKISPFQFSKVHVATDEDFNPTGVDLDQLGMIEVRVKRAFLKSEEQIYAHAVNNPLDVGPVPRTSDRSGYHQVSLGEGQEASPAPTRVFTSIGSDDEPHARFQFRHRPASVLQQMGIMPVPNAKATNTFTSKKGALPTQTGKHVNHRKGPKRPSQYVDPAEDERDEEEKAIRAATTSSGIPLLRVLTHTAQDDLDLLEEARQWELMMKDQRVF